MLPTTQFYRKIKSLATIVSDLQFTLRGIQGEAQDEALCVLGKLAEQALRKLDIFRRTFSEPRFLPLSILGKALKTLTEIPVSVTSSNLLQRSVLDCTYSFFFLIDAF